MENDLASVRARSVFHRITVLAADRRGAIVVSGKVLALLLASLGGMEKEFYQDFRGGQRVHHVLTRFGPNRDWAMRQEANGLRITLPAKRRDKSPVGLTPKFRISGDFEITVAYEILAADEPPSGQGAGVKIWGKIRSDDNQTWTLGHLIRPGRQPTGSQNAASAARNRVRNEFVGAFSRDGSEPEGDRDLRAKSLATEAHFGRLRLTRTGSELVFLAAEKNSETFQELQRVEVGTDAVMELRISANTSGVACGLSIRLFDLRVRADELTAAAPPKKSSKRWLVIWLLAIAITGTSGFLLWRYQPWRR